VILGCNPNYHYCLKVFELSRSWYSAATAVGVYDTGRLKTLSTIRIYFTAKRLFIFDLAR